MALGLVMSFRYNSKSIIHRGKKKKKKLTWVLLKFFKNVCSVKGRIIQLREWKDKLDYKKCSKHIFDSGLVSVVYK